MSRTLRIGGSLLALSALCAGAGAAEPRESEALRRALEAIEALEQEIPLDDPAGILTWVTLPRAVAAGASFDLVVEIENGRPREPFRLDTIDLGDEFLDGFELLRASPEPRQRDHSFGTLTLAYPMEIPPGATRTFRFTLRAARAGVFIGDVDVYEGQRFLTRVAQTRVMPE